MCGQTEVGVHVLAERDHGFKRLPRRPVVRPNLAHAHLKEDHKMGVYSAC